MDLQGLLSKEFLLTVFLLLVATVALFIQPVEITFVAWGSVCGGILAFYTGARTYQKKVEANGSQ